MKNKNEQEEDKNWQCVEERTEGKSLGVDQKRIERKIADRKSYEIVRCSEPAISTFIIVDKNLSIFLQSWYHNRKSLISKEIKENQIYYLIKLIYCHNNC